MKYNLPKINLKDYKIFCKNEKYTNFHICTKCKKDYIECWKKEILKELKNDCENRNIIKYLYNIKEICTSCNKKITDITWGARGIYLFCYYCNSERKKITLDEIQNVLADKYEYIDENELNTLIINSLNDTIITITENIHKRNCVLCNKEFYPYDKWRKKDMLCNNCKTQNEDS